MEVKEEINMKKLNTKILAIGLSAVMLTSAVAACKTTETSAQPAESSAQTEASDPQGGSSTALGGWTIPDSIAITGDQQAAFDQAIKTEQDYPFKAIFVLATQVVSGTNYVFLCQSTAEKNGYTLAYVNVDPSGKASLIKDDRIILPGTESGEQLAGGWSYAETPDISLELNDVLNKGLEKLIGVDYVGIALIGTQVVAGTNYAVLYRTTVLDGNSTTKYQLVYFNEDLQGNVTVTENVDINIGV